MISTYVWYAHSKLTYDKSTINASKRNFLREIRLVALLKKWLSNLYNIRIHVLLFQILNSNDFIWHGNINEIKHRWRIEKQINTSYVECAFIRDLSVQIFIGAETHFCCENDAPVVCVIQKQGTNIE